MDSAVDSAAQDAPAREDWQTEWFSVLPEAEELARYVAKYSITLCRPASAAYICAESRKLCAESCSRPFLQAAQGRAGCCDNASQSARRSTPGQRADRHAARAVYAHLLAVSAGTRPDMSVCLARQSASALCAGSSSTHWALWCAASDFCAATGADARPGLFGTCLGLAWQCLPPCKAEESAL